MYDSTEGSSAPVIIQKGYPVSYRSVRGPSRGDAMATDPYAGPLQFGRRLTLPYRTVAVWPLHNPATGLDLPALLDATTYRQGARASTPRKVWTVTMAILLDERAPGRRSPSPGSRI